MADQRRSSFSGALFGALTVLCWASYNVAATAGIESGLSPAALTFLRYVTPGFLAVPLWFWLRRRAEGRTPHVRRLLVLSLLGGPAFGLIAVSGYLFAPLSHGLLFAPVAVFVAGTVLGAVLLGETVAPSRILGALIMFGGLALLVGVETDGIGPNWPIGVALFVCAGTLWGVHTALLRHWRVPMLEGAAGVATVGAVIAAALLGPVALPSLEQAQVTAVAIQLVMQGLVGGVLSVVALIGALNRLSAQTVSMLPTFTPAVAMLIAWAALGTRPELTEIAGVAIILTGFAVAAGLIHTVLPTMKRRTI